MRDGKRGYTLDSRVESRRAQKGQAERTGLQSGGKAVSHWLLAQREEASLTLTRAATGEHTADSHRRKRAYPGPYSRSLHDVGAIE